MPDEAATTLDAGTPPDMLCRAALAWLDGEGDADAVRYTGEVGR